MRVIAEVLFWIGRLEHVSLAVLVIHSLAILRWRRDAFRRWLAIGWLALFKEVREVARLLGVSPSSISRWKALGNREGPQPSAPSPIPVAHPA